MSPVFAIDLRFRRGWCELDLSTDGTTAAIRTHWLNNAPAELIECLGDLLDGRRTGACRWPFEVGGGHFVDLVAAPDGSLDVAVHEFAFDVSASGVEEVYSARRGECVFAAHTTVEAFVVGLVAGLHRIRLRQVDPTSGMLPDWPHVFPTAALEDLGRRANRAYGYRPLTRADLDHHHPE